MTTLETLNNYFKPMLRRKSYTRLTLALDIIRKLTQGPFTGYHELGIIKHTIDLYDTITIDKSDTTRIACNNPAVPQDRRNVCWQAVDLLKKQYDIAEHVRITIEKNIPVMGGLAGGSTNAATTLLLLNRLWQLNLTREKLIELGRMLGMDVPYYFLGNTAFDSESTGILQPIPTNAKLTFVLVLPEFGVATKEAYQKIDYEKTGKQRENTENLKTALQADDYLAITRNCHNDFEFSVFKRYPELAAIKEKLLIDGCDAAFLSGSGSTMAGLVKNSEIARQIAEKFACRTLVCSTFGQAT